MMFRPAARLFLSTLSLRRATGAVKKGQVYYVFLSTLSLRRATLISMFNRPYRQNFYPRSPCGERRSSSCGKTSIPTFLSTLSLRRATFVHAVRQYKLINFYPRSPCGERRYRFLFRLFLQNHFYPRSPCGERQQAQGLKIPTHGISIHALLAESDPRPQPPKARVLNFYPRSPCGERLRHCCSA